MTDAEQLEAALDQLYHAILAADFGELPKILAKTDRLTDQLAPLTDKAMAMRLRHKANRNSLCLQAAGRGLRAAQRRLLEMNSSGTQLSTYTSLGQRAEVATAPGTMAKRL